VEDSEKSKDKKKKEKLRKAHSKSTTTISDNSIPERQPGELQGVNNPTQDPLQEKIHEQHNESSNSCLQPPPVKVSSNAFPFFNMIFSLNFFFFMILCFILLSDTCLNTP
jgi:hypothetical protein